MGDMPHLNPYLGVSYVWFEPLCGRGLDHCVLVVIVIVIVKQ